MKQALTPFTVAVGWSAYLQSFLHSAFGVVLPPAIAGAPLLWKEHHVEMTGAVCDLPAVLITLAVTGILIFGVRESSKFNDVVVAIKVIVVLLFLVFTASHVDPANWQPFIPPNEGTFGHMGVSGVFQGATTVFFAYIGFDAVTTTAQECKNPQRDLPIGVLVSLAVCTVLYILVSLVLTGLVPYHELNVAHPISYAVEKIGMNWLATLISIGAIAGLTSVLLMSLMGQPRIFYAMAKDGLFPKVATRIHPKYKTPHITTAITGVCCAICAGVLPIDILGELTSIGTLFAFFLVSLGVMILRIQRPDLPRKFKVPLGNFIVPILGMVFSGVLVGTATTATILRLLVWMLIGCVLYFCYGYHNSVLRHTAHNAKELEMSRVHLRNVDTSSD
jgi:APA family basic amino acid/polyamine antiporter